MKKTIFIGQAMPRVKTHPHHWPSLNKWLYSIGLTDELIKEHFCYTALLDYFPGSVKGSHLVPTKEEIAKERKKLVKTIVAFGPEIVVPIGALSISYCIGEKVQPLAGNIGKTYTLDPYLALGKVLNVIPLPHPSGASTWRHKKENKKLLNKALRVLKNELFT
jgi:uracil-DNA glycosylase